MEFLSQIEYWHWLVFGIILIVLEIFVPSAILLWPGIAGVIVGLINVLSPEASAAFLIMIWGVISVALAGGWQFYRKKNPLPKTGPAMNRRGEQYIGRHYTLSEDIINGQGYLHVDDTRWKIVADHDLSAGVKVKVTAIEGTSLRVEEYISG